MGATEVCYRHSDREVEQRCTRCGNPVCPDCVRAVPVGHLCAGAVILHIDALADGGLVAGTLLGAAFVSPRWVAHRRVRDGALIVGAADRPRLDGARRFT